MSDQRGDLDPLLLRSFVAVTEDLHFGRAAARLYLTQQAISRHVHQLEERMGVRLFDRSTRRVELTPAGRRLLPVARELLALQEQAVLVTRTDGRPLLVDAIAADLTPTLLIDRIRQTHPSVELLARFGGGTTASISRLLARDLDVAFGRTAGTGFSTEALGLVERLVRFEPLGLLVAADDPLTSHVKLPAPVLRGLEIDISAGNRDAPEWTDLAGQFLDHIGAVPSPHHAQAVGPHETAHHLRAHGRPILVMTTAAPVVGAVVLPLVDPVPLYPWAMIHAADLESPALTLLQEAVEHAIARWGWLDRPDDHWLPTS